MARGLHWVKPVLIAEVRFANWTGDGMLRQVKPPEEISREDPEALPGPGGCYGL